MMVLLQHSLAFQQLEVVGVALKAGLSMAGQVAQAAAHLKMEVADRELLVKVVQVAVLDRQITVVAEEAHPQQELMVVAAVLVALVQQTLLQVLQ
jgi:hypothetical protein